MELNEPYTNLTWDEGGIWKSWRYNVKTNKYYFDDVGNESLTELWTGPFLSQGNY